MIELLAIPLCAFLDRVRGGLYKKREIQHLATIVYGIVLGSVVLGGQWQILPFAAAFWVGETTGWGSPLGEVLRGYAKLTPDYEWWQFKLLKTYPALALVIRGLWWTSFPALVIVYWFPAQAVITFLSMGIAFPVAAKLASRRGAEGWVVSELYRGALVSSFLVGWRLIA